jgi:hypothetical protein
MARAVEHDGRVERRCCSPDLHDVEALIAQVEHGAASEPARLRRIEHLHPNTLFGAFRSTHFAMEWRTARRE